MVRSAVITSYLFSVDFMYVHNSFFFYFVAQYFDLIDNVLWLAVWFVVRQHQYANSILMCISHIIETITIIILAFNGSSRSAECQTKMSRECMPVPVVCLSICCC